MWPLIQDRFKSLLLDDPHPAVRFQIAIKLPWITNSDPAVVWDLITNFLKKETNPNVLKYGLKAVAKSIYRDDVRLEPYIIDLIKKLPSPTSGDDILTDLIMHNTINLNLSASNTVVTTWIANYVIEEKRLRHALFVIRDNLLLGFNLNQRVEADLRDRSVDFIWSLLAAIEPGVRSWPLSEREPTIE